MQDTEDNSFHALNNAQPFLFCCGSNGKNSMILAFLGQAWWHIFKSRLLEGLRQRITRSNNWRPNWAIQQDHSHLQKKNFFKSFFNVMMDVILSNSSHMQYTTIYSKYFPSLPSSHPTSLVAQMVVCRRVNVLFVYPSPFSLNKRS